MHMSEGKWKELGRLTSLTGIRELERCSNRLLRVIQKLRRSRIITTHPGPEIPRADDDVDEIRYQPFRFPGDQTV